MWQSVVYMSIEYNCFLLDETIISSGEEQDSQEPNLVASWRAWICERMASEFVSISLSSWRSSIDIENIFTVITNLSETGKGAVKVRSCWAYRNAFGSLPVMVIFKWTRYINQTGNNPTSNKPVEPTQPLARFRPFRSFFFFIHRFTKAYAITSSPDSRNALISSSSDSVHRSPPGFDHRFRPASKGIIQNNLGS